MELVLYDTEHFETLHTFIRLLEGGERRLHVLVLPAMRKQLEALGVKEEHGLRFYELPPYNKQHAAAVERLAKKVGATLLLLGTVSFRHYAFARVARRMRGCKVILCVHDVKDAFCPLRGSGLRGLVRQWGQKQLVSSVAAFAVLLPAMKAHILHKEYTSKPIYVVPGRLFDEAAYVPAPTGMQLVVPGSIDRSRRDYEPIRRLLQRVERAGGPYLEVTIIGSSVQQPDFSDFPPGLRVVSEAFVHAATYAKALKEASMVWAPLPERFSSAGRRDELYGTTKASGTFFDAVSAGRPLLLPAHIEVPEGVRGCTLTYGDDDELYYLLLALAENEGAQASLRQLALAAARHFTVENLRVTLVPQMLQRR
ncbi:MAG: hypothetical protein EOO08_14210 [Chitinophagaceae bacterium]|nr:MAG: hypothetical protein EOO08_14210 [Chitinophagaceae bacterium]